MLGRNRKNLEESTISPCHMLVHSESVTAYENALKTVQHHAGLGSPFCGVLCVSDRTVNYMVMYWVRLELFPPTFF